MDQAEREDLLLAVQRVMARSGRLPVAADLADMVHKPLPDVIEFLSRLTDDGEVNVANDGSVRLTSRGEAAAAVVMKKHKVLETFFEEMLGMDRETAHVQACTLEHHTTDETITRLHDFIGTPRHCLAMFHEEHKKRARCGCQVLSECGEGQKVRIVAVKGCGRSARLADLGLIPGQEVTIRRKMAQTLLVQVKDSDIAISADIARMVLVENCR